MKFLHRLKDPVFWLWGAYIGILTIAGGLALVDSDKILSSDYFILWTGVAIEIFSLVMVAITSRIRK